MGGRMLEEIAVCSEGISIPGLKLNKAKYRRLDCPGCCGEYSSRLTTQSSENFAKSSEHTSGSAWFTEQTRLRPMTHECAADQRHRRRPRNAPNRVCCIVRECCQEVPLGPDFDVVWCVARDAHPLWHRGIRLRP